MEQKRQIEHICRLTAKEQVTADTFVLTFEGAVISASAEPGQFVQVQCQKTLRRPLGIMSADQEKGQFRLGVKVVGSGTAWLTEQPVGSEHSIVGPLGHGFDFSSADSIMICGGGTGIFPLYFALEKAKELGLPTYCITGYRSKDDSFMLDQLCDLSREHLFTSDSGGLDLTGHAAAGLEEMIHLLREQEIDLQNLLVLSCGPLPLMRSVAAVCAREKLSCQVSFEERMACGTGLCLVCVCDLKNTDGSVRRERCCHEGPVFRAEDVAWDSSEQN